MSLGKSNCTLLLVEWKHVFPSPSKQFDKFDKLIIQGSLRRMKERNKAKEECMKEIEDCLFCVVWICSSWKWWNNYHQNIPLILDSSWFVFYCQTTKLLILGVFRHSGAGGQWGRQPSLKFPVDVPFYSDEPFKCALFERSNPKYTWKSTSKIKRKLKSNVTY